MNDKLCGLFGMARRAGALSLGTEAAAEAVKKKKAFAVFLASDIVARTEKEFRFLCKEDIPVCRLTYSGDEISAAVGKRTGIIAVCDKGFAKRALQLSGFVKEGRYTI